MEAIAAAHNIARIDAALLRWTTAVVLIVVCHVASPREMLVNSRGAKQQLP
ncbi:MAG: hypothetical protein SGJ11_00350 [Phycisphaerae bacterium]|nr:hypothetical protein [Phycisphaerae bacterium]